MSHQSGAYLRSYLFARVHLYTWVKGGTVRVKCLAQEHNTGAMPQWVRALEPDSPFDMEVNASINHEATAHPQSGKSFFDKNTEVDETAYENSTRL